MTEAEENAAKAAIEAQLEAEGLAAEAEAAELPILRTEAGLTEAGKVMDSQQTPNHAAFNFGACVACGRPCLGHAYTCSGTVGDGHPEYPRCRTCFDSWAMAPTSPSGALPLSDLRERIAILCAAGVTHYRDAGVELHFDLDARKTGRPEPKTERF